MLGGGRDDMGGMLVYGKLYVTGGREGGAVRLFEAVLLTTYCYKFGSRKWEIKQHLLPKGKSGPYDVRDVRRSHGDRGRRGEHKVVRESICSMERS